MARPTGCWAGIWEHSATRGALRFETAGRDPQANATVSSPPGVIRANTWQHVAAVVRRGRNETRLYVNGYLVARASTGSAQFDDTKADLQLGRIPGAAPFQGELADVRLYNRPLDEAEIQALVQPGKQFVQANSERKPAVTLTLGGRQFSGTLQQPAFLVVRLDAGPLPLSVQSTGAKELDRVVFTPLPAGNEVAKRFLAFEKRLPQARRASRAAPRLRQLARSRRPAADVAGEKLSRFVFEGAIRNFPSPSVEKDNVNYLAGVREIGVRSEYTDGRDMPRLLIRSVEFEGPYYESWPPPSHRNIFVDFDRKSDLPAYARKDRHAVSRRARTGVPSLPSEEAALLAVYQKSSASGRCFRGEHQGRAAGGADVAAVPVAGGEEQDAGAGTAR